LRLGVVVTALTLLATYPIALFLARTQSRWRGLLVALAIAPLLTSTVVRTYGWLVILGNDGLVNGALLGIGLIEQPLRLINDEIGVVIGLVEILMPYMALGLLSGFGRINPDLEEAAMSLGAHPLRAFWRVTLPLSLPGIATGVLLVFVLTISSFVTPQLLGGGRVFLMATEIYDQATYTLDWPFAAAVSFLLLVLFGVVIALYSRVLRVMG
jgi:putative spermidine/putrescine transport system permease protein